MLKPALGAALLMVLMNEPVSATTWGHNAFSDSVYWSEFIVVAKVRKVGGKHGNYVDATVQILESLKGHLSGELQVTRLDMGDASLNASPFPPIPDHLAGQELLLFLKQDKGAYEVYSRGLSKDGKVSAMAFRGLRESSLQDIRAMVAQLQLIQATCPVERFAVKNETAAAAACHTALHSKFPEVTWYGARRLLDRPVAKHLLDDLAAIAQREKTSYPIRYLLVQCMAKTGDERAVPTLIAILRNDLKDVYTEKALQDLTGQNFGSDAEQWQAWWKKRQN